MNMKISNKEKIGFTTERLTELRRKTLIESTGSSLRLSGSKVTNEQVEEILNQMISKPSEQK
jgi:hypothetical protein